MSVNSEVLWDGNPHWLGMLGWYLKGLGGSLVLSIPFLALAHYGHFSYVLAVLILVVLWALVIGIAWVKLHTTSYRITAQLVCQSEGILSRDWVTTPIVRLQDISVHQPLWERMLGIGTIEFDNASDRAAQTNEFIWKGVRHPRKIADLVEDIRSGAWHDRKQVFEDDEELKASHAYDDLDPEEPAPGNNQRDDRRGYGRDDDHERQGL